ncbi:hypothetical protein HMI54_010966 [Coelomomyces lativittatus]|nr:hypothetical protein HMI55_006822 [Coelomomyces lativittatus]KAJ1514486.1 hypothetical protein HMI56_000365 [Coelomomyces lativittatus]KAJ1518710.1 hypothetical protein HMI54_010966 [Coelomomyces lativittatus]
MPQFTHSGSSYPSSSPLSNSVTFSLSRPTPLISSSSNSSTSSSVSSSGLPTSVSFLLNPIYHSSGSQSTTPTSPLLSPTHSYIPHPSPSSNSAVLYKTPSFSHELPTQLQSQLTPSFPNLKNPTNNQPSPSLGPSNLDSSLVEYVFNASILKFQNVTKKRKKKEIEPPSDRSQINFSPIAYFQSPQESGSSLPTISSSALYYSLENKRSPDNVPSHSIKYEPSCVNPSNSLVAFSNATSAIKPTSNFEPERSESLNESVQDISHYSLSSTSEPIQIDSRLSSPLPPPLFPTSPLSPLPRPRGRPRKNATKIIRYNASEQHERNLDKKVPLVPVSSITPEPSRNDEKEPSHPMHLRRKSSNPSLSSAARSRRGAIRSDLSGSATNVVGTIGDENLRYSESFAYVSRKRRRLPGSFFHFPEKTLKQKKEKVESLGTTKQYKPSKKFHLFSRDMPTSNHLFNRNHSSDSQKDNELISTEKSQSSGKLSDVHIQKNSQNVSLTFSNKKINLYEENEKEKRKEIEVEEGIENKNLETETKPNRQKAKKNALENANPNAEENNHDQYHDNDNENEEEEDEDEDEEESEDRIRVSQYPIDLALESRPYLYFLKVRYTEVTAKNLKKRVVSDITCIQHDPVNECVWVVFDAQRVFTEFDSATLPIKYWIVEKLKEMHLQYQQQEKQIDQQLHALVKEVLKRTLLSRSRLIRSGYRLAADDITLPLHSKNRKTRSSNLSITSNSPEHPIPKKKRVFHGLRDRSRTQLVKVKRDGEQGPYARVDEPAVTPTYLQVMANEFYSTTKRSIVDLQSKYSFLMDICINLQKENEQLKSSIASTEPPNSSTASLVSKSTNSSATLSDLPNDSTSFIPISISSKNSLENSKASLLSSTTDSIPSTSL